MPAKTMQMKSSMTLIQSNGWTEKDLILKQNGGGLYDDRSALTTIGWLVLLRIYVALAVFQPYRDLTAGDNQSLEFKLRDRESNPGPLAP